MANEKDDHSGLSKPMYEEIEWTDEDERAADAAWAIVGPKILAAHGITPDRSSTLDAPNEKPPNATHDGGDE